MKKNLEPSRRSFIKGAGAALAGAAVMGLAGCAPKGEGAADAIEAGAAEVTWDEEFDVVIVGAGVAGESAAITLATEGPDETILLIEKGPAPSGNSPYALGVGIWTDDVETFYNYFKAMQSEFNMVPDDVMRAYAEGVGENKDWLLSIGANDDGTMWITECGEPTADGVGGEYPELGGGESIGWLGVGMADDSGKAPHICDWMLAKIQNELSDRIDYRTNAPLVELVQDPSSKAILGAVVEDGKKQRRIKANKGVIMALGGFESNPEMMQDYVGMGHAQPGAGRLNTGDGIRICQKIGADFWHMESVAGFWMFGRDLDDTTSTCSVLAKNPSPKQFGITVGVNGRRFYMDWDGYMTNPGYELLSDLKMHVGSRHGHMQFGGDWPHLPMPEKGWFIFDQNGLDAGALDDPDPVGNKLAYRADTIEELAELIEVPVDELVKTVNVWNGYVVQGEDLSFYRPAEYMVPVTTPPFYAQLVRPHFLNTDGGPKRSAKGEVLDPDGNPIPNLYSAGEFGSVWGNYYQGAGNIAECMIFGRISARSVMAN